jgi:hypothetical protein
MLMGGEVPYYTRGLPYRTVATLALTVRRSYHLAKSHLIIRGIWAKSEGWVAKSEGWVAKLEDGWLSKRDGWLR